MRNSYKPGFVSSTQTPCAYCLDSFIPALLSLDVRCLSCRIWVLEAPLLLCHLEFWVMTLLFVAAVPGDGPWADRCFDSLLMFAFTPHLVYLLWHWNWTCSMTDCGPWLLVLKGTVFSTSTHLLLHFVHLYRVWKLITLIIMSKISKYARRIKVKLLKMILQTHFRQTKCWTNYSVLF